MTEKEFVRKLAQVLNEDGNFAAYTNEDLSFNKLLDNEIAICGEDESEMFALDVIKVDDEIEKHEEFLNKQKYD